MGDICQSGIRKHFLRHETPNTVTAKFCQRAFSRLREIATAKAAELRNLGSLLIAKLCTIGRPCIHKSR